MSTATLTRWNPSTFPRLLTVPRERVLGLLDEDNPDPDGLAVAVVTVGARGRTWNPDGFTFAGPVTVRYVRQFGRIETRLS